MLFLPHKLNRASAKWHIDTLYFPCHPMRVKIEHTFPHSVRFAADNRNTLANIKTSLPISAAGLVNHILREYGIPAYKRDKRTNLGQMRPYTRRAKK